MTKKVLGAGLLFSFLPLITSNSRKSEHKPGDKRTSERNAGIEDGRGVICFPYLWLILDEFFSTKPTC